MHELIRISGIVVLSKPCKNLKFSDLSFYLLLDLTCGRCMCGFLKIAFVYNVGMCGCLLLKTTHVLH